MILIINREMMFSNREQYIGSTGDDNSEIRVFRINRVLPGGVDIAHLNFKMDLRYSNGEPDTCDLKKEITDEYIILQWEIVSGLLQVPGPMFANIRAYDDLGEVRWSSYKGVFYAEESIDTPGEYEGKLTELEEIELKLTGLEKSAVNSKEAAEAAKEAAEKAAEEAQKAKEEMDSVGIATTAEAGIVKPDGETVEIDKDGKINVPKATPEKFGVVKPDNKTIGRDDTGLLKVLMSGLKIADTQGAIGEKNAEVALQTFIDAIADKVVNQVLTKTMLVNNGTTEEVGKYPLDAAYGKTLLELCKEAKEKATPADWEINDESTPGYVKGRTHWKEKVADAVEILPETTVEFTTTLSSLATLGTDNIVKGTLYNVYWNGTLYECTAYSMVGSICLGNPKVVSQDEDTGEPFHIEMLTASNCLITKETSDAESITLKIEIPEVIKYHQIDPKYIPGGTSAQPDLSVNDPSDPAYVKNRTHWVEVTESEILEETTLEQYSEFEFILKDAITLTVGETYIVKINGVEYERVAQSFEVEGMSCIGMGSIEVLTTSSDPVDPFIVFIIPSELVEDNEYGSVWVLDGSGTCTISISQKTETIHQLDPKYIKDMYYTEEGVAEILPETTFAIPTNAIITLSNKLGLKGKKQCVVTWNGAEYTCAAQEITEEGITVCLLGDYNSILGGESTGEPFVIMEHPNDPIALTEILVRDGSDSATVSIVGEIKKICKIKEEYTPCVPLPHINLSEYGIAEVNEGEEFKLVNLEEDAVTALTKILSSHMVTFGVLSKNSITFINSSSDSAAYTVFPTMVVRKNGLFVCFCLLPNGAQFQVEFNASSKHLSARYVSAS